MSKDFCHLHNHTSYSALDGAAKVDELVAAAKADGQPGIAITDHGVLHGLIDFYNTCKSHEINPILGIESYFADDRHDRTPKKKNTSDMDGSDKRYYHLTVLAENNDGYHNLIKLSSDAFLDGYYYKPRSDWDLLEKYSNGLIATSGCLGGPILQELLHNNFDGALDKSTRLQDIFGKDNFFIELQNHGLPEQLKTNPQLIEISRRIGAPLIATNDLHYVKPEDSLAHDSLLCCQTGSKISDEGRFRFQSDQHYLKSSAEMRTLFQEISVSCDNTLLINERANVSIDFDTLHLPIFAVPEGFDSPSAYLAHLSFKGLTKRYGTPTEEQKERLVYELSTLESLGLSSYMLIVWDIVRFADRNNIRRGSARGSVAGSLVAYCMNISKVDPLRHGLIFERFLNPSRVAMPDIDLDWDSRYRDHIINYTKEKYGEDHVAQIITFSIIRARAAVRDAARVLGYETAIANEISKAMPELVMGEATPLADCIVHNPRYDSGFKNSESLRKMYNNDQDVHKIIDVALGLEGLIRQDGIHAAGVVISDRPITDYVPVQRRKDGPIVTQYEKNTIEDLGLLKMDYLGLKNLDTISETIKLIGHDPGVENTEFSDLQTFDLLRTAKTIGVFQLESRPMRNLLLRLGPTSIDDIAAVVALYRPGPMGSNMHNDYADRKNHRQPVSFFHEDAKDILGKTQGLMVFQEQVMQIAQRFAGYSMVEADGLRKIIGKKLIDKMADEKGKFVQGCIDTGYGSSLGESLFHTIEHHASYSFNASHAYGYAYTSYQTAFLKANFTKEYMAALCSTNSDDIAKVGFYLSEARDLGLSLKSPDVNRSGVNFTTEDNSIRVGLSALKHVGTDSAQRIVDARSEGSFVSLIDFARRVNPDAGELESLAYGGALEEFGTRFGIATVAGDVLRALRKDAKKQSTGQIGLFDSTATDIDTLWEFNIPTHELPRRMELENEHSVLGIYITGHPLEEYMEHSTDWRLGDDLADDDKVRVLVIVSALTTRRTRAGDMMATATVSDASATKEVVIFPKMFSDSRNAIADGDVGIMSLRAGKDNFGERSLIFQGFDKIYKEEKQISEDLFRLYLPLGFAQNDLYISKLKGLLLSYRGNHPVSLNVGPSAILRLPNEFLVEPSESLTESIKSLFVDFSTQSKKVV